MPKRVKRPYRIEDFLGIIRQDVDDAIDFVQEFAEEFEKADRYFNGEVDIEVEEGRSAAVATQVRDTIRNLRPSIMRVLTSNRRRLVKYIPNSIHVAGMVRQQEAYVHQLFWANNGYRVLYDCVDETLKHRYGPTKTYWEVNPAAEFARFTMMTIDEVQFLSEMPDVEILDVVEHDDVTGNDLGVDFFDVELIRKNTNGRIRMEAVPYGEFFISRNATSTQDARIHGHYRSVTVSEAIELGIEYDDWWSLDDHDSEESEISGQVEARRRYQKREEQDRGDVLSHKFQLIEAYVYLDLENDGFNSLYCIYLGGTGKVLLDYQRESESPFDVTIHDPRAFTVMGTSIGDITVEDQDVLTSMLRGSIDNLHMANTPRLGANPQQVNFDDLMNFQIGHPIRFKGSQTTVQVVSVPSQIQATLPMLQWYEQMAQNKVGVTKAAQGLDPNAMQSTDKEAVQNTIQLSQGQVELAVRNIIETGIVSIFRKLLKLSIQHMDRVQMVRMRGNILPVDQLFMNPDLHAEAQVGLGTVSDEQRFAGLNYTFEKQMMIYQTMGIANPFVTATHMYNTLEDITEMFGLYDVSRYYNMVTPEIEEAYKQQKMQEAQQAGGEQGGMDPAAALLQAEQMKQGTEKLKLVAQQRTDALQLQLKALEVNAKDDLERDKLAQQREIQSAKVEADKQVKINQDRIKAEQNAPRESVMQPPTDGQAAGGAGLAAPASPQTPGPAPTPASPEAPLPVTGGGM